MNALHYLAMCQPSNDPNEIMENEDDNEADEEEDMDDGEQDAEEESVKDSENAEDQEDEEEENNDEEEVPVAPPTLKKKADSKVEDKKKLKRKAHNAGLIKCAEYFLKKGADLNCASEDGTPLLLSLRSGNKEFTLWLLKKGALLKGKTEDGGNVLHLLGDAARLHGIKKIIEAIKASASYKQVLSELAGEIDKGGEGYAVFTINVDLCISMQTRC